MAWPCVMAPAPVTTAAFALMHAIVTVCAGIVSGRPADSTASRAMLDVFASWITVPSTA